ncbi:RNA polymerase II-associated factor 1 homolog isoform X2 [Drosophila biarmipes]|uniref:RNA polymerase II-associated factor 1 homolog isoform X2 n=1 Tax=Drosophila biarmipes TaxID=125945 RepID=UPI0007E6F4AF|nr:RNA polymerase II-associated factor 1 homolog isoform X2 [Drosophila biarmipes]
MPGNEHSKSRDADEKHQFICPIVYKNEMPGPASDAKLLPCGRDILEYTEKPVSLAKHEAPFEHHFRGLHELLDFDLLDQLLYDGQPKSGLQMDTRDAALLADIEPLTCGDSKPRPSRAQECDQMFTKERVQVPRPRTGLKRSLPEANVEPLSVGQQRDLIDKTFEEVKKPLLKHPTKPGSTARPLAIWPVFPDTDLLKLNFLQIQFDIPPSSNESSQTLIKDCGNYMVNFSAIQNMGKPSKMFYLSDQRYKEEKCAENSERGERFILREKDKALHYVSVEKHIKLRRERPRPQDLANKCLLQVKQVAMETK